MKQTRNTLKSYFETGDRPTEGQFEQLIHSYAHLNEFNFGLSLKPSATSKNQYFHFYRAINIRDSGAGHKTVASSQGSTPQSFGGYNHVLSRNVTYKTLEVTLIGDIDIALHQPKMIIERYKQRKKYPTGYIRPAGYYKEEPLDAQLWDRKSEYNITSDKMNIDLKPINYFRPNTTGSNYKDFVPSGALGDNLRPKSFKFSRHSKPFVPIRIKLQITIDNVDYISQPVDLKIILGSSGEFDAINFVFNQ